MTHAAAARAVPLQVRVDHYFATLQGRTAPGYSVGILRDGEVLMAKGYGLASLEQQTPLRRDSKLRIASVSKQFTVAAVLLLQSQGLLCMADDVRRHLPELAGLPQAITLEQLARNTSGLPDMLELLRLGGVNLDLRLARATLLQTIARCKHLNFTPGSRFLYCNSGFALLGLLVERISGQSLDEFLQQQLFRPLGMQATRMVLESDRPQAGLATPYLPDGHEPGHWRRAMHGFEHGGEGGLVSSVEDLLIWAAHMLQPGPGMAELVAGLQLHAPLLDGHESPYARGLEHGEWQGLATVGHGGLWPGFRTEFLLVPQERLAVVVISNDGGSNPYKVARELAGIALDRPAPTFEHSLVNWQGRWLDAELGQLIELSVEDSGRVMCSQWGAGFELQAGAGGSWSPLRGVYEFQLRTEGPEALSIAIGAGRVARLRRIDPDAEMPEGLPGCYYSADADASWRIDEDLNLHAEGPLLKSQQPWTLHALSGDLVELRTRGYWMQPTQLLRLRRDAAGGVQALLVDTGRVKGLEFVKQSPA